MGHPQDGYCMREMQAEYMGEPTLYDDGLTDDEVDIIVGRYRVAPGMPTHFL